jgi:hypothetical protein
MRASFLQLAVLYGVVAAASAESALAVTLNPVDIGGVFDTAPFSGVANGKESTPFIASVNNTRESAVVEFNLSGILPGTVEFATFKGSVYPNNSFDTGTRIHNVSVYSGNGTVDLADYNVAATSVGSFSHPSGGHTDFVIDVKTALQTLLDSGATHFGARIEPGANPQGYDVLSDFLDPIELEFSVIPTGSTSVNKLPVFDARAELSSGSFVVTDGQTAISVQRIDFASIDRRAIMEFSLSDIPAGSNITNAKLDLDITSFTSSPPEYPILPIYGYAGNGVANLADATQTSTKIADSEEVQALGDFSIALNPDYIESLLGTSSHFGLLMLGSANYDQVGFATKESSASFGKPTLVLTYVAPKHGDYNGNGTVGPEDYTDWRSKFGMTGAFTADGNGNNVVDAADYVVWRNNLSPAASSATNVPEPAGFVMALIALVFSVYHRP